MRVRKVSMGASMFALASTVSAQVSGGQAPNTQSPGENQGQTVVVTGSRTISSVEQSPTPLTVASPEQLQLTPSGISDALNKLPQFNGSTTNVGAGNGAGSGKSNLFTGNFMNLRSFGSIRTLILLDGIRVAPTALNGQVDTNTLPQMLVRNVDIVTGGVSSVYGSDAVMGVVNYALDKRFSGFKAVVQGGISDRGDGKSSRIGVAGGFDLGEHAHAIVSAEQYDNKGVPSLSSRSWGQTVPVFTGAGTAASPYVLTENPRLSTASNGGLATSGPFKGQQFVGTGTLAPFNPGTATATTGIAVGGDGSYFSGNTLVAPVTTDQIFGRVNYDFNDNVSGFLQANFGKGSTNGLHNLNGSQTAFPIYSGNAFLPASAQAQLTSSSTPFFGLGRVLNDLSADATLDQSTTTQTYTAGLSGEAFDGYTWNLTYTHGEARIKSVTNNNISYSRLYAGLDAVRDPSGAVVCKVTITNPSLYPGCVPVDLLGAGNVSGAAKSYIYSDTSWSALNSMSELAANISGEPFSTWAGPATVSFNVEHRNQALSETPDANSLTALNLTGIRLGSPATAAPPSTAWAYPVEPTTHGSASVYEAGTEILLPLAKNLPWAKRLAINGAYRYTDYSTSGAVPSWKLGLIYQPVNQLRFRASASQDIRAPSLADLFAGSSSTFTRVADPHTGVTGNINVLHSGNPNLVPEIARTYTGGLVFEPSWLPNSFLSVDYYQTTIANAIGAVAGNDPSILAECERTQGASPVCGTIVRPLPFSNTTAANFPTALYNQTLNLATAYTRGIDVEASYRFNLARLMAALPGEINLRALYAYQPVLNTQTFSTSPVINAAGAAGLSAHRITLFTDYKAGPLALALQTRYYSAVKRTGDPTVFYADRMLPSQVYSDLNFSYDFALPAGGQLETFLNVGNVFDKQPRISPAANRSTIPGTAVPAVSGDDLIGRYYTTGIRVHF
ncbi:MAG: TonB-dependent receptor [Pseudomonadota bacterium]|nr:TonB-dependent receptor [Pseudomonadota bacterium]